MGWFSSGSRHEREQILSTVRSLGATSIPGLSAALAWPERRTQKVLEEALREGTADVRYDPVTRAVRYVPPPAATAAAPPPTAPEAPAPVALPRSWTVAPRCTSCSTPLVPTGTGATLYCPSCGRLRSAPVARAAAAPPVPQPATGNAAPPAVPAPVPAPPRAVPPPLPNGPPSHDRRAQELLAAWVTARPIPCPRCRTTLRHRGVSEYACPACGETVRFEGGSVRVSTEAPTGPAPAPAPVLGRP